MTARRPAPVDLDPRDALIADLRARMAAAVRTCNEALRTETGNHPLCDLALDIKLALTDGRTR